MKRILLGIPLFLAGAAAWAAVNINTAGVAELDAVKGITPKKAAAIVEYRDQNGPFKSLDELKKVKGFGDKSVAKLSKELVVGEAQAAKSAAPAKK